MCNIIKMMPFHGCSQMVSISLKTKNILSPTPDACCPFLALRSIQLMAGEPVRRVCIALVTHCGLVTPYGDKELCQHLIRYWLVAWRHQAITWTNVDLSSLRSHSIHLCALSLEDLKKPINKTRLKIAVLKWHPGLPGANVLKNHSC